jgi:hypothetical protein
MNPIALIELPSCYVPIKEGSYYLVFETQTTIDNRIKVDDKWTTIEKYFKAPLYNKVIKSNTVKIEILPIDKTLIKQKSEPEFEETEF